MARDKCSSSASSFTELQINSSCWGSESRWLSNFTASATGIPDPCPVPRVALRIQGQWPHLYWRIYFLRKILFFLSTHWNQQSRTRTHFYLQNRESGLRDFPAGSFRSGALMLPLVFPFLSIAMYSKSATIKINCNRIPISDHKD